jgi:hypothetical protein
LQVAWYQGTASAVGTAPVFGSGYPVVDVPIVDPNSGVVTMARRSFGPNAALAIALGGIETFLESQYRFHPASATLSISDSGPGTALVGSTRSLVIENNDQIIVPVLGDGSTEVRGNIHGGETLRDPTITGFKCEVDYGDGAWVDLIAGGGMGRDLMHGCRRARLTFNTKVQASDAGSPFVNVDHQYTIFDDGTCRMNRSSNLLEDQPVAHWFHWMTSFAGPPALVLDGRLGSGETVVGQVDYRTYLTTPVITSVTTSASGGTLPAGVHTYRITRLTATGESLPSAAVSVTSTGSTSSTTTNLPASVASQIGWGLYDASGLRATLPVAATTYVDTGAAVGKGQPPTKSTAYTAGSTYQAAESARADWSVMLDPVANVCFGSAVDAADTIAAYPNAVNINNRLEHHPGVVKSYITIEGTAGIELPIAGTAALLGTYKETIPAGTVISMVGWHYLYAPADLAQYEREMRGRFADVAALEAVYPTT